MTLDENIYQQVKKLPNDFQEELLDFIHFLLMKVEKQEEREWTSLSLDSAMRGMEDEVPLYTHSDLKVFFG